MAIQDSNPYASPVSTDAEDAPVANSSRWQGFKTGFRNGTLWSLLLVIPTAPAFYGEMTIQHRFKSSPIDRTSRISQLSLQESAFAWFGAIGTALTAITLPWGMIAGCVGHAQHVRQRKPQ